MADIDEEWDSGFDDVAGSAGLEDSDVGLEDQFAADVTTVDAQDTLDVSAQFFRVCARVYMDNPLHQPVYQWLSSLPRTGAGNIKAVSDHLVMALRLYVDTLNAGSTLRLGPSLESGGPTETEPGLPHAGGPHGAGYSSTVATTPSIRYRQSQRFKENLSEDAPSSPSGQSADSKPVVQTPSAPGNGATSVSRASPPTPPTPSAQPPSPPQTSSPVSEDGLSYVARLAREGEGW